MGRNLTNLYVSESFQYILQVSGSDELQNGLGTNVSTLDITVSTASVAAYATESLIATSSISASYSTTSSLPLRGFINAEIVGTQIEFTRGDGTIDNIPVTITGSTEQAVSASYASYAAEVRTQANNTQNTSFYVGFVDTATGQDFINTDSTLRYNPATNTLSAGIFDGNLTGTVSNATSASYVSGSDVDGAVALATTASYVAMAEMANTANTASYVAGASVDGAVALASTASYVAGANVDGIVADAATAATALTATSASHALQADSATLADSASDAEKVTIVVQNASSATLPKGLPIHITGATGNTSLIVAASASNAATMPAQGALAQELAPGADGIAIINGAITGVNTSGFTSGEVIYVAPNGGYTDIRPSGEGNLVQNLGVVRRVDVTNGSGELYGAGRSNDTPNPGPGKIFVGNSAGDPVTVSTGSINVGSANTASYVAGTSVDGGVSQVVVSSDGTNANRYVPFAPNATGDVSLSTDAQLLYNPSTNVLTVTTVNGNALAATSASHAITADQLLGVSGTSYARTDINNTFSGNQQFNDITVNGTGSFSYIESVTGSAKIIGDAFLILNNNTPSERYAGIKVIDSGSTQNTSSFQYDGQTDDWFLEKDVLGSTEYGIALFGPEYTTKGSPTYNANNTLLKGGGGHHINDSNITDDGSLVKIVSNTQITGSLGVSAGINSNVTGNLTGNADTATSASHAVQADNATSSSHALQADNATSASYAANAGQWDGSYVANATIGDLTVSGSGQNNLWITDWPGSFQTKNYIEFGSITGLDGIVYDNSFESFYNFLGAGPNLNGNVRTFTGGGQTYFSSFWHGPNSLYWLLNTSGSQANERTIALRNDTGDVVYARVDADDILIGDTIAGTLTIGNSSATTEVSGAISFEQTINGTITNATSASHAVQADNATTSSYVAAANVDGTVASATSASYAPTNTADNITWTGENTFNDRVLGGVNALSIASLTASMDASTGNYFTLALVDGSDTNIDVSNVAAGQTYILRTTNGASGTGTISFGTEFKFAGGSAPSATATANAVDVYTFVSFDTSNVLSTQVADLS